MLVVLWMKGASQPYCCSLPQKKCYPGGILKTVLLSGVAHFQRECSFFLCHVEGHMLMNGGRREAIKGSSWPLAAMSALGAGSGAAVQLFLTEPWASTHWRGCFPAVCCHDRRLKGPHRSIFRWQLRPVLDLFGVLICIACLPKVKNSPPVMESYRMWQTVFVTGINLCMRKEERGPLSPLSKLRWEKLESERAPDQPMQVSECEKPYQSLDSYPPTSSPVADLKTNNSIFTVGSQGTWSSLTDTVFRWVLCTK